MWRFLCSMLAGTGASPDVVDMTMTVINPATGMPMVGNCIGGVDVGGSPFGMDIHASPRDLHEGAGPHAWD